MNVPVVRRAPHNQKSIYADDHAQRVMNGREQIPSGCGSTTRREMMNPNTNHDKYRKQYYSNNDPKRSLSILNYFFTHPKGTNLKIKKRRRSNSSMNSSVIEYNGEVFTRTDYNGISVLVDSEGYYNASKICSDNDTQFSKITKSQYWASYIDMLQRLTHMGETALTKDRTTLSNEVKGIYIHPKLVNYLCIHVNLEYAIKVGEIMDSINERIHQENTTLQEQVESLRVTNTRLNRVLERNNEDTEMLMDENDALHEDNKNLTNNVNELRTRAVPKNTNNKLLRIMKRDGELYKISANSYWPDKQFEDQGYTIIRHFSFPASMNVRQKLLASEYVSHLYFAERHLNEVYRIIRNEHPLNEW